MKAVFTLLACIFITAGNGFGQVTENFDKPDLSSGNLACWSGVNYEFASCRRQMSPAAATLADVPVFSLNSTRPISGSGSLHVTDTAGQDIIGSGDCVEGSADYLYTTARGMDGDTVSFDLRINNIFSPTPPSVLVAGVICGDFFQTYTYTVSDTGSIIHLKFIISGSNGGGTVTVFFSMINDPDGSIVTEISYFSADIDNFSTNAVPDPANSCLVLLPVQLNSFTAFAEGSNVRLNWQTAAEINFDRFVVEHSIDGNNYDQSGNVPAGGQSSGQLFNYSWVHASPSAGINYYRLKMMNKDGRYKYSNVKAVRMGDLSIKEIKVYPNPVRSYVQVLLPAPAGENTQLKLYSAEGRLLKVMAIDRQQLVQTGTETLVNGIYYIKIVKNNHVLYNGKLVKQ